MTNMSDMFKGVSSVSQDVSGRDINIYDVSIVFDSHGLLHRSIKDICGWHISNVADITYFRGAWSFNQDVSS